jgi:hypothetical protein
MTASVNGKLLDWTLFITEDMSMFAIFTDVI